MDYVHLAGVEQVQQAASTMRNAADEMQQAARNFEQSLFQQRCFMDDWLSRLEDILSKSRG